eukprot:TRINITY_DN218_c0_g1_i2.p1 TRINITY_DN218_c0_g1~~TRINITY_DN218_c0_g1_i2.p1  ORF type:complete len:394 (-),score=65.96 TRINITY_DN218_c0_g1_i2:5-1186(-)
MAEKRISNLDRIEDLVFVNTRETSYRWGGYKKELVTQNLTALEETLFVCSVCRGIMYETCSIKGGLAQVCESCIGEEVSHHPVASIRSTISKLVCKCALYERGCEWEGRLGGLVEHMEECNEFIVQCPYIKYGCKRECKRGNLEEHRKEAKEYHTEVVSVFMADKVDSLEKEKKEQAVRIQEQAVRIEQQAAKIQKIDVVVREFSFLKDYLKLNGIIWTITNRNVIVNRIHQLLGEPQIATGTARDNTVHGGDANYSLWNGTNAQGPRFVVHSFYHLYPILTIQSTPNARLNLQVMPHQNNQYGMQVKGQYQQHNVMKCMSNTIIWPLTGKCEIILVNQTNPEESWKFTMDNFQVQNAGNVNITNIPFEVLLDEKYNKDNTFVLKILIDPFCP